MDSQSPMVFNGDSPLHVAVRQGQIEDVRNILVQQQLDVNILNSKHETPLHLACSQRDSAIVQLLIAFGANPCIKNSDNNIAYHGNTSHDIRVLMNSLLNHCTIWINGPTPTSSGDNLLHAAVRLGELENVQMTLEQHLDGVNEVNSLNETPLHIACALGHKQIVYVLMANGADMYARDCCNNAPIHGAVSKGHLDIMNSLIITFLCDPKLKGYQGRSLLHFACGVGNADLVNTLIKKYCISPMATDAVNQTPLHIAASHGQEEIVCLLITKYNHPVEYKRNFSFTPLHLACFCGHLNTVRTLLTKHSADLEACCDSGSKPIHQAAFGGHIDILQMLTSDFSCSPHTRDTDGQTILHYACYNGSTELSQFFITDFNLDPLVTDNSGVTPLHMACMCGYEELARLLITKYNCPVDVKNESEETPLHTACSSGNLGIVKILVSEYNANLHALNHQNSTPLHTAVLKGHLETMQTLIIEFGCSPQVKGFEGKSLLHYACYGGMTKLVITLITEFNLDPISVDDNGETPLHVACMCGHEELARLLITKYNCPIDIISKNKLTPLNRACSFGHYPVVRMLVSEFKANLMERDHVNDTPVNKAALGGHADTVQMLITEFGCDPQIKGFGGRSLLHQACNMGHTNLAIVLITKFNLDPLLVDKRGNTPLHMACMYGHEELARLLLTKYNCPVDVKNKSKETPLHTACSSGHLSIIKMLVSEYNANPHALNDQNSTPLHLAVLKGHLETMQTLIIEFGCSPQVKGFEGCSLLHYACYGGMTKLVKPLITEFNLNPLSVNDNGDTPLHRACMCGHETLARLLITKYNCPVDVKNKNKETPLHKACSSGHLSVVRMLVSEFEADTSLRNGKNDTAVSKAAEGGHVETVEALITELGCSPMVTGYEGRSLLHEACRSGSIKLTEMLITSFNLDVLSTDDSGNTPLHMASLCGHAELARLLINKYNCPVGTKDKNKQTPLHKACSSGHLTLVRLLILEFKADVNVTDDQSSTPLCSAALGGHENIVQTLISEFGCSPHVKGYNGRSLLHYACDGDNKSELAETLITKFKLDPLSVDNSGYTPLHIACWCGHEELARLLITKYNCSVDTENENKQTPLHIACSYGHLDVSKVLISEYNNIMLEGDKRFCNTLDKDDNTPLDLVIKNGDTKAVHILSTEYGCKPHVKGAESQPLLHQLTAGGFITMLKELISNFNHDPASVDEDGNTILHAAGQHRQLKIVEFLVSNHSNQCPVDCRNSRGQTALHHACMGGHTSVAKFLVTSKADITVRDEDGDTPLKKAFLSGHVLTFFQLFNSNLCTIDSKLLYQICERGSVDLIDILLSDFNLDPCSVLDKQGNQVLHIATLQGHKQVIALLVKKYKCPIDSRNFSGQTPLHLLCSQLPTENGYALIETFITEFKADVTSKDRNGDQPIHAAAQAGCTNAMISLILDRGCHPNSKGFKQRTLLHQTLAKGHTSTAKTLIEVFHRSLHCTDEDGNTPLHLSSLYGQIESVKILLYEYHAPIYVRNKAGKTALDLATEDSIKKMIREYTRSEHKRIQQEYDKLRSKSLQKYSGQQTITRVFVLGNPGSGKSTLVESLKRKGISYFFAVPEADIKLHTAGIIPSVYQSSAGRLLYYDFAGEQEYFSSHAAILEVVSHSTVGNNVYLIVADLMKDDAILHKEIGYWLSFISYHGKALDSQCSLKVVIVLSHSDCLQSETDSASRMESVRQYLTTHMNQCNKVMFDIVEVISSNCRLPRSSKNIESVLQQISKSTTPHGISYEASLLHGLLEKDFSNVVACKFQDLLNNIKEAGICLPTVADVLYPTVKELHDIGLLMIIGQSEDQLENHLLLLDIPSLTNEVHQILFSKSAEEKLSRAISSQYAKLGIFPESFINSMLPDHITKECLVQLQYCQEFSHADVGLDYSMTQNTESTNVLLYFPALCQLESEHANWPHSLDLDYSIGWFAKCIGKLDYFPPRYLHVLLLRLTFMFALPASVTPVSDIDLNEVSLQNQNCHCTMWKNGIHWLMREGVECIVEVVNESKGVVIVVKSRKQHTYQCIHVLTQIANVVIEAKTEFNFVILYRFNITS